METPPVRLFQKQKIAWDFLHDDETTEIAYWGWAWWGKSLLGSLWLATQIANKPWSTWGIWRSELKKIKLSTFITFKAMLETVGFKEWSYKYDDQKSIMTFTNWCLVVLMDLNDNPWDPNFDRLGSTEYTWFFIDEAQEVSAKAKQIVTSRLRNLTGKTYFYSKEKAEAEQWIKDNGKWVLYYNEALNEYDVVMWVQKKPKLLMTLNPWRNFVYTDFYKPAKDGTILAHRQFIQSLPTDNPFLPPAYIDNLRNLDKVSKERLLYWNFEYSDDPWLLFTIDDISAWFKDTKTEWEWFITVDAARQGKDKTVICLWEWMAIKKIISVWKSSLTDLADMIKKIINENDIDIDNVIVDEVWVGWGLVDILGCRWFIANAAAIQPYSAKFLSYRKRNYSNIKTQAFFYLQKFTPQISIYKDCEFKEQIIEEALFIRQVDMDNDNKIKLESKKDLKDKLGRSPDYMDAISFRMWWLIKEGHWEVTEEDIERSDEDINQEALLKFLMEDDDSEKKETTIDFDIY